MPVSGRLVGTGSRSAWGEATRFAAAVYGLVRRVPAGRVVTYGQVAALLGVRGAARAVGAAMRRCGAGVPWHRVVNASGGISWRQPVDGMLTQRLRLEQEGVVLRRGRVSLSRHRWMGPSRRVPGKR